MAESQRCKRPLSRSRDVRDVTPPRNHKRRWHIGGYLLPPDDLETPSPLFRAAKAFPGLPVSWTDPNANMVRPVSKPATDALHHAGASTASVVGCPAGPTLDDEPLSDGDGVVPNLFDRCVPSIAKSTNEIPIVRTLDEAFEWGTFLVRKHLSEDKLFKSFLPFWRDATYIEFFSGVCGHGHAVHELSHAFRSLSSSASPINGPRCVARVDNDKFCIAENLLIPDNACQFGDICSFFIDEIQSLIKEVLCKQPHKIIDSLLPIIKSGKAIKTHGSCLRHKHADGSCRLCAFPDATFACVSTVCTAESTMNTNRPGTNDTSTLSTCAFAALLLRHRPRGFIHECVFGRRPLLEMLLSEAYIMDSSAINPLDLGWSHSKPREYIVGRDVRLYPSIPRSLSAFVATCFRACAWPWGAIVCIHGFPESLVWPCDDEDATPGNILDDELNTESGLSTQPSDELLT